MLSPLICLRFFLPLISLFIALTAPAEANFYMTGDRLMQACENVLEPEIDDPLSLECMGYIVGVIDAVSSTDTSTGSCTFFALPKKFTVDDAVRLVVNSAKTIPDKVAGFSASALVIGTLQARYPCP